MTKINKIKVLWFVNTPSLTTRKDDPRTQGSGSWIEVSELYMSQKKDIELAVAFLDLDGETRRFRFKGRKYYALKFRRSKSQIFKWFDRLRHNIDWYKMDDIRWAVEDFKPDIIHVFGTEGPFGLITRYTDIPVVIRVQGILQSLEPIGRDYITLKEAFVKSRMIDLVFGLGPYHADRFFSKLSKRENEIIKLNKYFIGQTDWDKSIIDYLAPSSVYFRIMPVVRGEFHRKNWTYKKSKKLVLITIISPSPYKGFEKIIQAARSLKAEGLDFVWKIVGSTEAKLKIFYSGEKYRDLGGNLDFLGLLNEKELVSEMLKSNIYVHSSRMENECTSIIEALTLGMPIVVISSGGINTYLKDEKNGLVVFGNDSIGLAAKIMELYKKPDKAIALGLEARNNAKMLFRSKENIDKISNVYREVLDLESKDKNE